MPARAAAVALLLRSEAARRRKVYALLLGVFFATTTGLSILLGAVAGIEDAIGHGLRETVSSGHRVAPEHPERLADGRMLLNATTTGAALLARVPGARVAPRIEFDAIVLHTDKYEDFDTALVVGLDPARDARVSRLPDLVVRGRAIDAENVWVNGTPYPQILVGEKLLERLNMTIYDGTTLAPASLLNVTAGRFSGERGEIRPVVRQGIVVGAFRTGFEPVDRRLVYVHLETARELLRMQLDPDPATVLLVDGAADAALRGAAGEVGLRVSSASDFREEYLHAVLVPIRAFKDLVTVVLFAVAAGWVTHVVVDTILTDRRRLAVLRALGVPASLLVSPVAAALLAVASAGTLAGLALAWAVARALGTAGVRAPGFEHLDFVATLPPLAALGVALGALAVALVAAGGAALALRRIGVTEALRQS